MKDKDIKNILNSVQEPFDPAHWEAIRPELEARNSRRSVIWPWYLLASVMMLALAFLFWQGDQNKPFEETSAVFSPSQELDEKEAAILELDKEAETAIVKHAKQAVSTPLRKTTAIEALPVRALAALPATSHHEPGTSSNFFEAPGAVLKNKVAFPLIPSNELQLQYYGSQVLAGAKASSLKSKSRMHFSSGLGMTVAGWLNPEGGRLWYGGATAELELSMGAWQIGISPALMRTNDHFKDEWLPVDIADENPEFRESNLGAFAPMTVLQKQQVAFAPQYQVVLPVHLSWQYRRGRFSYAAGPELGLIHGWGDAAAVTEGFLGLRGAVACHLGSRSFLRASFAYGRPFSDSWTGINRAALTFHHFIN